MKDKELSYENPLRKSKWQCRALGDVCDVKRGSTITKKSAVPGDVPVVAGGISPAYFHNTPNRPANVITVSGSGANAGYVNFFDVPIWASDCSTVLPKTEGLNVNYVHRYLLAIQPFIFKELARGAAQPHVYPRDLARLPIPLPSLEEQLRIVEILDEAFEGLARAKENAEVNLQSARELLESYKTQTFETASGEFEQATLEDVSEFITDGTHQTPKYFDQGHVFLSAKNIKDGRLDWDDIKYIDEAQHKKMQKRLAPKRNDLLIRKNGAGYGAAALVDRDVVFDVYVSLAVVRPLPGISPEYLLQFANSSFAQAQFKDRIKGQGVPNLHLQEIRQVMLPLPEDVSVQQEIAEKVKQAIEAVQPLKERINEKLQDVEDLRQSLLQKAFAGELT